MSLLRVAMKHRNPFIGTLAALALAGCVGTASTTPTPTTADETASPSPVPTSATTESASPSPAEDSASADVAECENTELGYTVEYPADWWANERVEPDFAGGTPIPGCTYFAPKPVELQPNAGLPGGIAIWFDTPSAGAPEAQGEVLDREETTVDGQDAVVIEYEPPVGSFSPEGTVIYEYLVTTDDGVLAALTDAFRHPDYEPNKRILDAMMESLELED